MGAPGAGGGHAGGVARVTAPALHVYTSYRVRFRHVRNRLECTVLINARSIDDATQAGRAVLLQHLDRTVGVEQDWPWVETVAIP